MAALGHPDINIRLTLHTVAKYTKHFERFAMGNKM